MSFCLIDAGGSPISVLRSSWKTVLRWKPCGEALLLNTVLLSNGVGSDRLTRLTFTRLDVSFTKWRLASQSFTALQTFAKLICIRRHQSCQTKTEGSLRLLAKCSERLLKHALP